jgi:hypothetical protein
MRLLIALKILLRLVAGFFFTPAALRGTRRDLVRLVAPSSPVARAASAPPAPSSTSTLTGVLADANRQGILLQGQSRWINYGKTYQGNPLSKDDIGRSVELVLIHAKSGSYVRSIRILENAPPAQRPVLEHPPVLVASPRASGPPASANQIAFVHSLRLPRGLTEEDLEGLAVSRFKRGFRALSASEMSQVITFLGGYQKRHDRRRV